MSQTTRKEIHRNREEGTILGVPETANLWKWHRDFVLWRRDRPRWEKLLRRSVWTLKSREKYHGRRGVKAAKSVVERYIACVDIPSFGIDWTESELAALKDRVLA